MNDRVRAYYASALESHQSDQQNIWSGNTSMPSSNKGIGVGNFFLGAGTLAGAGYLPLGKGRVWDKYVSGLRHFEEYFFAKIPRTLQLSNIFSQFNVFYIFKTKTFSIFF